MPNNGLIGHYTFDSDKNRLENTAPGGGKAIVVEHVGPDGTYSVGGKKGSLKVSGNDYYTGKEDNAKAFDLSRTASDSTEATGGNSAVILDAVPTGDNFTISFAVKIEKDGNPSNKKAESIFTIGTTRGKGGYNLVRGDNTDRLKFGDYSANVSNKGANLRSFFATKYKILTIVVNNGTVKTYDDGKEYGHKADTNFGDGTVSNALKERHIIFGAYYQQEAFNNNSKVMIDEIYVYNRALDSNEVSQLYKAVTTPLSKIHSYRRRD